MIYQVRTRFDLAPEPGDDLGCEFVANLVAAAVRRGLQEDGLDPSQGVTVYVRPRGAKVHAATEAAA
jgi:hypothetical protein